MLVTVATFMEPQEAHMLRGRLWAQGIFAVVSHAYHVGNNWAWSVALGGAKVQVRLIDYAAAREIERHARAGEYEAHLQQQLGDLDDADCPNCHSKVFWRRAPVLQGAVAIVFSFLVGTVVPPWRRIRVCKACGTEFKERYGLIGRVGHFQFAMTFGEAALPDFPEILQLADAALRNRHANFADRSNLDFAPSESSHAWLCRIDGVLRGFSVGDLTTRCLSAICVDPDFERNGIGRQLHNRAVDWLFANGSGPIWNTVTPYTKAQKFFRAAGWKLVEAEPNGDYRLELDPVVWNERRKKF